MSKLLNEYQLKDLVRDDAEVLGRLEELAKFLTCRLQSHSNHIRADGRYYTKIEHIASRLQLKLRLYASNRLFSEQDSAETETEKVLVLPSTPEKIKPKTSASHTSAQEQARPLTTPPSAFLSESHHQRPELRRETGTVENDISMSFLRRCQPSSRTEQDHGLLSVKKSAAASLSFPSPQSPLIISPGSVVSPDPSEVFSVASTTSTQASLDDYDDASDLEREAGRRDRFRDEQLESPAQKRDIRRIEGKRRSNVSSYRQAGLESGAKQLRGRIQFTGEEDPFSSSKVMAPGVIDENVGNMVGKKGGQKSDPVPEKVGNMIFFPVPGQKSDPVSEIFKTMRCPYKKNKEGTIYGFADKASPGFLKIGYIENEQVKRRLSFWRNACGHDLEFKFQVQMPCSVHKMETLIKRTLHAENRLAECPNRRVVNSPNCGRPMCKTDHNEWYKISFEDAQHTVKSWQSFSELIPYMLDGRLEEIYCNYAVENKGQYEGLATREWLDGPWKQFIERQKEKRCLVEQEKERLQTELTQMNEEWILLGQETDTLNEELKEKVQLSLKKQQHAKEIQKKLGDIQGKMRKLTIG